MLGFVHLRRPEETRSHPMIARSRSPRRASAAWGMSLAALAARKLVGAGGAKRA